MTTSAFASAKEAATVLNISTNAVYDRIRSGSIPAWAVEPREKGALVQIKRRWLEDQITGNITALPQRLTQDDYQRIADAVCDEIDRRALARGFRAA